ncbi:MAG: MFS transporter [Geobacteraceae bacterium]
MTRSLSRQALRYRWLIFWILSLGYLLVFFHRLCPAVVAVDMMRDLHAGGGLIGLLGSAYFYPYAIMQIPTGLLSDSWGPRRTISLFLVIACGGSILLGLAPSSSWALVGRVLVGLGVSTLFVCTLKAFSQWFHPREFASMTGMFMAMGGLGSFLAAGPLAYVSTWVGWRSSFLLVGGATLLIALLVWLFVRDTPADIGRSEKALPSETIPPPRFSLGKGVRTVLAEPAFWPFAVWFFFNSGIYFTFIGLWGGPYLLHVYGISKAEAGTILSLSAVGLMAGSPLVSFLSNRVFHARRPVLILSSIISLCLTAPLAFATASLPLPALYLICLGIGATTAAAVVVAFTAVKELFPLQIAGTATGLINLFPFAGGAVLQPLLGFILERNGRVAEKFAAAGYTKAFFILFLCAALACGCSFLMRETFGDEAPGS